jgi:thiol:disulfide interchange protein
MGATALACLWLLSRQGGTDALILGLLAMILLGAVLGGLGIAQRHGRRAGLIASGAALAIGAVALARVGEPPVAASRNIAGAEAWTNDRVAQYVGQGRPVFVYFTADWCLTCKVNEASAIDRAEVRQTFGKAGVKVLAGDWTGGDPAITRFLESRGRAGVPLYLWYAPGKEPEELPQVLTPSMLISRARAARR